MDNEIVVYPYNVLLLINKKEQATDTINACDRREKSQKYYTEWKKSQ